MQQANWTKLRRLKFQELSLRNGEDRDTDISAIVTSFLVRHPKIECLHFYVSSEIALSTLPPSFLPKLRSLFSDLNLVTSPLFKTVISRLVHLTFEVGAQIDSNTLPQMDKLESLCLVGCNGPDMIDPFLSKASSLKKIFVNIGEPSIPYPTLGYIIRTAPFWVYSQE
ncbi:hypothetical protein Clacol_003303 [Clathrus columnatus]|uniref:Uncharacterized protein n=1 Tax=Clathrus columnatus TaxID=1419009 RepID=A0AAV5A951_9AGAM|nr:hypothetical protein Clacol_003303 [Clathrus columnatus]